MIESNATAPTDDEWADLFDDSKVSAAREQGERQLMELGSDQITLLKRRAKNDLFFLTYGVLGYDRLSLKLHGHLCRWMQRTRGRQYRMQLLPRNHYKSTVITEADGVQMALPNLAMVQEHPYCLGPNVRILLAHERRETSSRFLFDIAMSFRRKPLMLALFPELIPDRRHQRMNKWELELPRESTDKEPTYDTIGTGAAGQGNHYNWGKLDDLIGQAARDSLVTMQGAINWFDNFNSFLERPKLDGWDLTGTHWADGDVYHRAIEVYGVDKKISVLRNYDLEDIERMRDGVLSVYGRGIVEDGQPIFPEEFSLDFINRLRTNPLVFAAQYANNPRKSGLTEFDPAWLKFYNVNGPWIYVFAGTETRKVNVWELDRVVLIDPSPGETVKGDKAGIIVTGTDKNFNIYILETVKASFKPPQLIDEMFRLYTKWQPRVMSVEEVTFSNIYRYWFEEKCRALGIHPNVIPAKVGTRVSKDGRIRQLTNFFSAGQVVLSEGMHDLRNEYDRFPLGGRDKHLLDALAQGPLVWSPGLGERAVTEHRKAEEAVLSQRDEETGY